MAKPSRIVATGGALVAAAALAAFAAGPVVAANPPGCVPLAGSLGVEFVLDNSTSMTNPGDGTLPTDPTNLRGAAAKLGIAQLPDGDWAGVAKFSTAATAMVTPAALNATSRAAATTTIDTQLLPTAIGTNYEAAFAIAQVELDKMCTEKKAVIFLSDGRPTQGSPNPQNHKTLGAPMYTIALGPDSAPDATGETTRGRLARLAAETGGKPFVAADATELQNAFVSAVLAARGIQSAAGDITVKPGESGEVTTTVPAGQAKMGVTVSWPIGSISASLVDPSGKVISASGPGVVVTAQGSSTQIDVTNPAQGQWKVRLQGISGPPAGIGATVRVTLTAAAGGQAAAPVVIGPAPKIAVSKLKLKGKLVRAKKSTVTFTMSEAAPVKVVFVIKGAKKGSKSLSFTAQKGANTVVLPARFLASKAKAGTYVISVIASGGNTAKVQVKLAKLAVKK